MPIAPARVDGTGRGEPINQNYPHPAAKYDVLVIGGGSAGLSGALVLARSRRSVLVIDAGAPRNAPAATINNFLSRDGMTPLALLEMGRAEVRGYGGQVLEGRVRSAARAEAGFSLTLEDGRVFAFGVCWSRRASSTSCQT